LADLALEALHRIHLAFTATSTLPSGALRTQPCTLSRMAAECVKYRKPTPWTRPRIKYRRATRMRKNERLYWIDVHAPCPVLIVEDDADLREMMAQLLTLEGYRAETASNGREALKYLHDGPAPDLILLDLMMPVMDGWEFRKRQRDDPALARVPVVVLTALDQAQARAEDLNGVDFLKKPLDFDRLLDLVRQHCRQGL
jgi:CheY-like chemotaxis protein